MGEGVGADHEVVLPDEVWEPLDQELRGVGLESPLMREVVLNALEVPVVHVQHLERESLQRHGLGRLCCERMHYHEFAGGLGL